MSAGTVYKIGIEFTESGRPLDGMNQKLSDLEKKTAGFHQSFAKGGAAMMSGFTGAADKAFGAMTTMATATAAIVGAAFGAGITTAIKEGFSFADQIESAKIGIGTIASALGSTSFDGGFRDAEDSVERLRKLAMKLPGETKDAVNAYQNLLPVGITHGVANEQLESMAARGVAVASAIGVNQNVFAHEMSAILEGRATSRMPAVAKLGLHAKDINAMSFEKRMSKVSEIFDRMDPAIEKYSHSFAGLTSSAKDAARQTAKIFSTPLFESTKNTLENVLAWYGKNTHAVDKWATYLGERVQLAYEAGRSLFVTYLPIAIQFGEHLIHGAKTAAEYLKPLASMIGKHGAGALGTGAALVGGAKVASLGVSGGQALSPIMGATGLGGLAGAGVGMAALAAASVTVGGALAALSDRTFAYRDVAVSAFASIQHSFSGIITSVTTIAQVAGPLLLRAVEVVGTVALGMASGMATGIEFMTGLWGNFFGWMGQKLSALGRLIGLDLTADSGLLVPGGKRIGHDGRDVYRPFNEVERAPAVVNHNTTVHGGIRIEVSSNQDPGRIAKAVYETFQDRMRNPIKSERDPDAKFRPKLSVF